MEKLNLDRINIKGAIIIKPLLFLDVSMTLNKDKFELKSILKKVRGLEIKHFTLDDDIAISLKKDRGDYFTIHYPEDFLYKKDYLHYLENEISKILKVFLKKYHTDKTILVVGLGNDNVLADSFGVKVTNQLIATNQYNDFLTIPKIALFNPSVSERTGISSFSLIKNVVNNLKPDLIIVVDSLATKDNKYLNRTIEINDCGIIPGSALRDNKEINQKTFNVPIITIGATFIYQIEDIMLSKASIDLDLEILTKIVSKALNKLLLS